MKVAFIQRSMWEIMGIMFISAVLKEAGHKCEVFIGGKNIVRNLKRFSPDIIGISVVTDSYLWSLDVAKKIKENLDVPIVFGGPHPTFYPQVIKEDCIDMVCRGEGEYAMLELVNKLENGEDITKIKNFWIKQNDRIFKNDVRPFIKNLDDLPFPDREIYYKKYKFLRDYPIKTFLISRGCPYNCSFCCNYGLKKLYKNKGKFVRIRSVDNVIEEIKQVKEQYKIGWIQFVDDIFILNHSWLKEFFKKYPKEVGVPYACTIRADLLNAEIVKGLKKSGCIRVSFGIESGNDYLRNTVLNKDLTKTQIIKAAALLKKYKIKMSVYNMVGIPGETIENAFETLRLNRKIKADWPWCSILQPYPGTKIANYFRKENSLIDIEKINSNRSLLNQKNVHEFVNLQKLFYYYAKFPIPFSFVKFLITLPLDKFYDLLFYTGYAYRWVRLNQNSVGALLSTIVQRIST